MVFLQGSRTGGRQYIKIIILGRKLWQSKKTKARSQRKKLMLENAVNANETKHGPNLGTGPESNRRPQKVYLPRYGVAPEPEFGPVQPNRKQRRFVMARLRRVIARRKIAYNDRTGHNRFIVFTGKLMSRKAFEDALMEMRNDKPSNS